MQHFDFYQRTCTFSVWIQTTSRFPVLVRNKAVPIKKRHDKIQAKTHPKDVGTYHQSTAGVCPSFEIISGAMQWGVPQYVYDFFQSLQSSLFLTNLDDPRSTNLACPLAQRTTLLAFRSRCIRLRPCMWAMAEMISDA